MMMNTIFRGGATRSGHAATAPGIRAASTSTSYLERRRRDAKKQDFISAPDLDDTYLAFPNERLGNRYSVNWKLAGYGCPPTGDNAFHNLHVRHLKMYCEGKAQGPNKVIHCVREGGPVAEYVVADGYENAQPIDLPSIDGTEWRKLMLHVTSSISDSKNVFVNDGYVGSRPAQVNVRTITTDANAALYLKNIIHQASSDVDAFQQNFLVFHNPDFDLAHNQSFGVGKGPFAVYMLMSGASVLDHLTASQLAKVPEGERAGISTKLNGLLVLGGTHSLNSLRESIQRFASFFHLREKASLSFLDAAVFSGPSGHNLFVFDLPSEQLHHPLFSFQGAVWNAHGIFPAFGGITHEDVKLADGSSLVHVEGGRTFVSQAKPHTGNPNGPSSLVFINASGSGPAVEVLDADRAASFIGKTATGAPSLEPTTDAKNQLFAELFKQNNSKAYVINGANLSRAQLGDLLDQLANGNPKPVVRQVPASSTTANNASTSKDAKTASTSDKPANNASTSDKPADNASTSDKPKSARGAPKKEKK